MERSSSTEGPRRSQDSNLEAEIVLFDHLPASQTEYDAVEKRLRRRVDWALMPVMVVMIVLNYLDRNALPNARLQGIEKDLGLVGDQFNICISVMYAGYLALQVPSNLVLTRVKPSVYLPTCMALWGMVSACTAAVHNFTGLVMCRFFLGILEAPFFPGALLLLSSWYTPRELATRTAIMYTGSLLSSAFGGLVGAAVEYGLDGARGLRTWQWLFLLEGTVTVAFSLASILILPDFPATTSWLSMEEKAVAVHRLRVHSGTVDEEKGSVLSALKMALLDYKVWLFTLIVLFKTSAAAVSAFVPTLVATFGFGTIQSLLMTAPPYVFAAVVAMGVSISSDKVEERFWHLVGPLASGMLGYIIAASTRTVELRYFSLFLMLGGVYGCFDITYAWLSSTIPRPLGKRSAAFAIANMVGNIAQVYSPQLYDKSSGPLYLPAMIANCVFVFGAIVCAVILLLCLKRENRELAEAEARAAVLEQEDPANEDDGTPKNADNVVVSRLQGMVRLNRGFRYML